jgi:acyl-CoA oxidase
MIELSRDPAFRLDNIHDMSKDEIRELTMQKFSSIVHYVTTEKLADFNKRMTVISYTDSAFWTREGYRCSL